MSENTQAPADLPQEQIELLGHKINAANESLTVLAVDRPAAGGAHCVYTIGGYNVRKNPHYIGGPPWLADGSVAITALFFQNGDIDRGNNVNGITHEALLAILVHRLECFQAGPFACRENAIALTKLQEAQHWLHHRTRGRMERGVEGTHQV